jgi:hypothetical protein
MDLLPLFGEVRLASSAACRAWTADRGCFSSTEWEAAVRDLPALRAGFESARLRISEVLSVEGIDPLGIVRQLLIHESAAPLSRAELRAVGFVHLESASGIHLYALWAAWDGMLGKIAARFRDRSRVVTGLRTAVPVLIWAMVFALSGFRPGLVRPLVLVAFRLASARFGFRWSRAAPIFVALAFDAAIGFFLSFGTAQTFADWAPGEFHYAAAWWGGVLGYEWARERGWSTFRAHVALSVAAWIAVLPLDLASGGFAPATPLLSLLTIEFLVRGGYALFFGLALIVGFGAGSSAGPGLEWGSLFFNRGVGIISRFFVGLGALREVPEEARTALAFGVATWVSAWAIHRLLFHKPLWSAKRRKVS